MAARSGPARAGAAARLGPARAARGAVPPVPVVPPVLEPPGHGDRELLDAQREHVVANEPEDRGAP